MSYFERVGAVGLFDTTVSFGPPTALAFARMYWLRRLLDVCRSQYILVETTPQICPTGSRFSAWNWSSARPSAQ